VVHEGRTNFSELQADLAKDRQDRMLFYVFDILFHHREDLRSRPQVAYRDITSEGLLRANSFKGLSKELQVVCKSRSGMSRCETEHSWRLTQMLAM